jgi:hypothetical protein
MDEKNVVSRKWLRWRYSPRRPTDQEVNELFNYSVFQEGPMLDKEESDQITENVQEAAIAVFDNYISDGPGYRGKVMMVVWPGSPSMFDVYIWSAQHGFEEVKRDKCCG